MIRKLIFSICMMCLVLVGCTDDNLMPSPQTPLPAKTVPVRLNLSTETYNTPPQGETRAGRRNTVWSVSNKDMDIELLETPVTRGAAAAVDKENAIYNYAVLQFKGTTENALLYGKAIYPCPDGVIKTADVQLKPTNTGTGGTVIRHRFVVITNVNNTDLNSLTENNSTYSDLQKLNILKTGNPKFPLRDLTVNGASKETMIMCGLADASINIGEAKQLSIALRRTVAKVTINITTDYAGFSEFKNWDLMVMSIPDKSYFNILGRTAVFPAADVEKYAAYGFNVLTSPDGELLPLNGKSAYIPVNLQLSVATSPQSPRRDNAPIGGTYLQIMGREMVPSGVGPLPVVKDFVLYQIYLGSNLTTDFSVYPNYNLTYNITLKGRSDEDSNMVRFIPGYFSGELIAYDRNGNVVTAGSAVKWKYSKRLEAFFQDSKYTGQAQPPIEDLGRQDLRWQANGPFNNRGATSLTDGRANTQKLQAQDGFYLNYPAAQACYGGLNGLTNAGMLFDWYLPSVSELIGTWISSASTANQLSSGYWSSTALKDNSQRAFIITNEGEVKTAPVNSDTDRHYVRGFRNPDAVNAHQ
ncbi:DUF4906 domain-containing protein [Bacteroides fragilis]|uniref:Putative lipoprotein n=1 Tax=Bacteroides fragilis str. 2-F-2 \|nr:DUF4906 domain-containing protein [Bacteroides fragilis]EXY16976.1 putative lipoprotein [Bacteroides fragilis str. 2-F-2 \